MTDAENVGRLIYKLLRESKVAITRDVLVLLLQSERHWLRAKPKTDVARLVRSAMGWLLQQGHPVISAGEGFKLASMATEKEVNIAIHLTREMATSLHQKADAYKKAHCLGVPEQMELFP